MKQNEDYPATDYDAMAMLERQHAGKNETLLHNLFLVYWQARVNGQSISKAYLTTRQVYLKSIGADSAFA